MSTKSYMYVQLKLLPSSDLMFYMNGTINENSSRRDLLVNVFV